MVCRIKCVCVCVCLGGGDTGLSVLQCTYNAFLSQCLVFDKKGKDIDR